jgi:hypothetical protein
MSKQGMGNFAESEAAARGIAYDDIWLVAGRRTPFADYNTVLRDVSPTDLGIAAARALFAAQRHSRRPRSTRSSPATWRSRASTPTTCRATSGCTRA